MVGRAQYLRSVQLLVEVIADCINIIFTKIDKVTMVTIGTPTGAIQGTANVVNLIMQLPRSFYFFYFIAHYNYLRLIVHSYEFGMSVITNHIIA